MPVRVPSRPLALAGLAVALGAAASPGMHRDARASGTRVAASSGGAVIDAAPRPGLLRESRRTLALERGLVVPVAGVPASRLRDAYDEGRVGHVHRAIDIAAPRGTPVVAATGGRLLTLHHSAAGGNMVYMADSADRFILMYAHLDRYARGLVPGAPLRRGQLLGYVGTTGNAPRTAPHLHFAVSRGAPSVAWWKGTPLNPYPLLVGAGTVDARSVPAEPAPVPAPKPATAARKAVAKKAVAKPRVARTARR